MPVDHVVIKLVGDFSHEESPLLDPRSSAARAGQGGPNNCAMCQNPGAAQRMHSCVCGLQNMTPYLQPEDTDCTARLVFQLSRGQMLDGGHGDQLQDRGLEDKRTTGSRSRRGPDRVGSPGEARAGGRGRTGSRVVGRRFRPGSRVAGLEIFPVVFLLRRASWPPALVGRG